MQNLQTKHVITQTTTTPPITPPAMGPAADPPEPPDDALDVGCAPIFVHIVIAQLLQPPDMSEQTSSGEHDGHGGAWGGQPRHLLNRLGLSKSSSTSRH